SRSRGCGCAVPRGARGSRARPPKASRGRDLLGHLEWKAVGIGEAESGVGIDPPLALRGGSSDRLVDHREALRERPLELLLLVEDDLGDAIPRRGELVVVPLHRLDDLAAELRERAGLEAESAAVHRRAPDEAAEDVAAKLVRGRDAVRDE